MRLIAPPLPPHRDLRGGRAGRADLPGSELPAEMQAQLEQPSLGRLDALLVLAPPDPLGEVELIESVRRPLTWCDATRMAERLRVGLVGGGPWARRVHAPASAPIPSSSSPACGQAPGGCRRARRGQRRHRLRRRRSACRRRRRRRLLGATRPCRPRSPSRPPRPAVTSSSRSRSPPRSTTLGGSPTPSVRPVSPASSS